MLCPEEWVGDFPGGVQYYPAWLVGLWEPYLLLGASDIFRVKEILVAPPDGWISFRLKRHHFPSLLLLGIVSMGVVFLLVGVQSGVPATFFRGNDLLFDQRL
jgi:hypothetical protein